MRLIPRDYALTAFIRDVLSVSIQAIWRQIDTVFWMLSAQYSSEFLSPRLLSPRTQKAQAKMAATKSERLNREMLRKRGANFFKKGDKLANDRLQIDIIYTSHQRNRIGLPLKEKL